MCKQKSIEEIIIWTCNKLTNCIMKIYTHSYNIREGRLRKNAKKEEIKLFGVELQCCPQLKRERKRRSQYGSHQYSRLWSISIKSLYIGNVLQRVATDWSALLRISHPYEASDQATQYRGHRHSISQFYLSRYIKRWEGPYREVAGALLLIGNGTRPNTASWISLCSEAPIVCPIGVSGVFVRQL